MGWTFRCRACGQVVCREPFYYGQVPFCSDRCRGEWAQALVDAQETDRGGLAVPIPEYVTSTKEER